MRRLLRPKSPRARSPNHDGRSSAPGELERPNAGQRRKASAREPVPDPENLFEDEAVENAFRRNIIAPVGVFARTKAVESRSTKTEVPRDPEQAFVDAASAGNSSSLGRLLSLGTPPLRLLAKALHGAVGKGHMAAAARLIESAADVDFPNPLTKARPLHLAAETGHLFVFRLLLDSSADSTARGTHGRTPAQVAAEFGHIEPLEELYIRGLSAWGPDSRHHPMRSAVEFNQTSVAEFMVHRHGSSAASLEGLPGGRLIHLAASKGHGAMLDLLLRHGAELEARTEKRAATPLMVAAASGEASALRCLLERHGADLNVGDLEGSTALHWAAKSGSFAATQYLLDARADARARDARGISALDVAILERNGRLVKELGGRGGEARPRAWHERREKFEKLERDCHIGEESSPMFGVESGGGPSLLPLDARPRIRDLREAQLKEIRVETRTPLLNHERAGNVL